MKSLGHSVPPSDLQAVNLYRLFGRAGLIRF